MVRVAILGGTGYGGMELLRYLLRHPAVQITAVTSRRTEGRVGAVHPHLEGFTDLAFTLETPEVLERIETVLDRLDALAAESVRFEWAFAQAPEMLPSLATVFSGLYPTTNGLRQPGDSLQAEATTLAELAGEAGMATAAFVEGAPGGSDYGLAQGFASYQVVARPGEDGIGWMNRHAAEDFLLVIAGWGSAALDDVSHPGWGYPYRFMGLYGSRTP